MTQDIRAILFEDIKPKVNNNIPILSKLSHELKTPIHGIRGISSYLLDNWDKLSDSEKQKYLAILVEASDNLTDLLNLLLINSSGKDELEFNFERIDLIETTRYVVEKCKNLNFAKNEITIIFKAKDEKYYTVADKFWISQLLSNLIANAINYSGKGEITVSAKRNKINGADGCIISVRDEGVGIAKEELISIFDPFYRGSRGKAAEGAGLGLAICREIVEAHGGKIFASNNSDVGSTVEFFIPLK